MKYTIFSVIFTKHLGELPENIQAEIQDIVVRGKRPSIQIDTWNRHGEVLHIKVWGNRTTVRGVYWAIAGKLKKLKDGNGVNCFREIRKGRH